MPTRLVHRTWSIRTVSGPFPVPLFGCHPRSSSSTSPSRANGDRRRGGGAGTAPAPDPMETAESDLSSFVRRSQPRVPPRGRRGCDDDDVPEGGRAEDGGTYVSLSWIRLPATDDDDDDGWDDRDAAAAAAPPAGGGVDEDSLADLSHAGRKRPRSQLTGAGATRRFQSSGEDEEVGHHHHHHHHLHVHVWVRDEEAAQLVLCFARFAPSSRGATMSVQRPVDSFAYVLVRGSPAAYLPVLSWLEETSGCRVGPKPFRPSPADVGRAAADWTLLARRRLPLRGRDRGVPRRRVASDGREEEDGGILGGGGRGTPGGGRDGDNGDDDEADDAAAARLLRPLEVTFEAPRSVAEAGLERITLTVPPTALWRLCRAIEDAAPAPNPAPPTSRRRRGRRPPGASDGNDDGADDESRASPPSPSLEEGQFPIVAALHSYFRESFRVDLSSFPLSRAASSAAVIGRDGRCKPLDVGLVGAVLGGVGRMVEGRVGRGAAGGRGVGGVGAGRDDDDDDEGDDELGRR